MLLKEQGWSLFNLKYKYTYIVYVFIVPQEANAWRLQLVEVPKV